MLAAIIGAGAVIVVAIVGGAWHLGNRLGALTVFVAELARRIGLVETAVGAGPIRAIEQEDARAERDALRGRVRGRR